MINNTIIMGGGGSTYLHCLELADTDYMNVRFTITSSSSSALTLNEVLDLLGYIPICGIFTDVSENNAFAMNISYNSADSEVDISGLYHDGSGYCLNTYPINTLSLTDTVTPL